MSDLNKLKELAKTVDFWGSATGWQPDQLHETIHFALKQAERLEAVETELARRDGAAGEPVHFYREHNPNNGMKTDWIEVDSMQLGFLQESTDPETAEFRTLYAAAQPSALPWKVESCPNCASKKHSWDTTVIKNTRVQDGLLKLNETSGLFYLGCDECSETLLRVSAEDFASYLNNAKAHGFTADGD